MSTSRPASELPPPHQLLGKQPRILVLAPHGPAQGSPSLRQLPPWAWTGPLRKAPALGWWRGPSESVHLMTACRDTLHREAPGHAGALAVLQLAPCPSPGPSCPTGARSGCNTASQQGASWLTQHTAPAPGVSGPRHARAKPACGRGCRPQAAPAQGAHLGQGHRPAMAHLLPEIRRTHHSGLVTSTSMTVPGRGFWSRPPD